MADNPWIRVFKIFAKATIIMTIQLPSLVFVLIIATLTFIDAKRLNTIITPFSVTAWPLVMISIIVNFFLGYLKFSPVTIGAHFFIIGNLLIIWLVGFIFSHIYQYNGLKKISFEINNVFKPFVKYQFFFMIISLISILIIVYRVYSLMQQHGGWWFFGDERFEKSMIVGPTAHVIQVAKVCFLFLFFTYRHSNRKALIFATLTGLIISIALNQVKYHVIWLIIIAFLYLNIPKSLMQQMKGVLKISLLIFAIMNFFWISMTIAWGSFSLQNKAVRDLLINNSINYFVSGPIVLDQWLDWANIKPDWTLLIVFKNIMNVIMGDPTRIDLIPYVSHGFIETAPGLVSNVGTSFGLYYLIGGYPFTIFMTTTLAIISYLLYFQSFRTKNPILVYLNILFLMLGMLSFFGQYFTTLSIYELTAMFIFFIAVFQTLKLSKN